MCREVHTIMITFHSYSELTVFIFLVIDITVLNHTIMLLAIGIKLDRGDEQVKKRKKYLFGWNHG